MNQETNGQGNPAHLSGSSGKSKIEVRMPKFRDASNFIGALAAGDASDMMGALDREFNVAAFALLVKSALRSPAARDDIMFVMADLWIYDVSDAEIKEPHEEWEYDPDPELVEKGQAIPRGERWKAISSKNRRRLVKKYMLEDMELDVVGEFVEAFKRLPYVADFLESRAKKQEAKDGESETPSQGDMDGETGTSKTSTAPESVES
jgi:hypothetical protein